MTHAPPSESHRHDPPANRHEAATPRWFIGVLVAAPSLLVLATMLGILNPSADGLGSLLQFPEMLSENTPTGGDLGAHVLLPRLLEDVPPRIGWPLGWSNAWFAGFPVLYLYFPLPMLSIVALDMLLPYGVAFKVVSAAGLVVLPLSTYLLVRWLGFDRILASMAALSSGVFVFMSSYSIYGGNIKSTLAGEFSYSWSLALSVLYIGLIVRDSRTRNRYTLLPGIVLGLVALSHVLSVAVVVSASAVLLTRRVSRRVVVGSWVVGFGVAAFWAVPFAVALAQGMSPNSRWLPLTGVFGPESPIPAEVLPALPLAAVGLIMSVRRGVPIAPLLAFCLMPLGMYFLLPLLDVASVNNGRFLPYWYYGLFVLAGIGVGFVVVAIGGRMSANRDGVAVVASIVTTATLLLTIVLSSSIPSWVQWDYSGYEGKEGFAHYDELMSAVDKLPAGRMAWEYNDEIHQYGTTYALMLFPYWSDAHPSMQGMYFESSLTTPFNFINQSETSFEPSLRIPDLPYRPMDFARATRHLALYNVAYYVSYTAEAEGGAREFGLREVLRTPPWTVFALPQSDAVDVAVSEPTVWSGDASFADAALEWYEDVDHLDRWLTAAGPEEWTRVESNVERLAQPGSVYNATAGAVSNIRIEDERISFDTTAVGVPHLVKVSYFPNWRADGADGPYRAAPSLMVVVPTDTSVVLEFGRGWSETTGFWLTVITFVGCAAWWIRGRRAAIP